MIMIITVVRRVRGIGTATVAVIANRDLNVTATGLPPAPGPGPRTTEPGSEAARPGGPAGD